MNKLATATLLAVSVAGCTPAGKLVNIDTPNECGAGGTGFSRTPVMYGDSLLSVLGYTEIGKGSEWRLMLKPRQGDDPKYVNARVTIKAAPGGPAWLEARGEFDPRKPAKENFLRICVPDSVERNDEYKYEVEVENVGVLDPRAKVIR